MRKPLPSRERLLALFDYEPDTGLLRRRVAAARMPAGSVVDGVSDTGYVRVCVDGVRYRAHRIIWKMVTGEDAPEVDHRDTVRSNNRWENLRAATHSQNQMNARLRSDNTSGFKGVAFHRPTGRWIVQIHAGGRVHYLGLFDSAAAGHVAYLAAAERLHGEFARAA